MSIRYNNNNYMKQQQINDSFNMKFQFFYSKKYWISNIVCHQQSLRIIAYISTFTINP